MNKSLRRGSLEETEHIKFPFQRHQLRSRHNNINRELRMVPVVGESEKGV